LQRSYSSLETDLDSLLYRISRCSEPILKKKKKKKIRAQIKHINKKTKYFEGTKEIFSDISLAFPKTHNHLFSSA